MQSTQRNSQNKSKIELNASNPSHPKHSTTMATTKQPTKPPPLKITETRNPYDAIKQKATAESISETKRMLSNGI